MNQEQLHEIESVRDAFASYLKGSQDYELIYSELAGYILLDTSNLHIQSDSNEITGVILKDGADLCDRLLTDIAFDVFNETNADHSLTSMDEQERKEIIRRWELYMPALPQYRYICNNLLKNK